MFWHMAGLSATSPVESLLDRDGFTLDELLDEDELIQECKSLNNRLINFLRGRTQVEQLVKYVVEEPSEGDDSKRVFKFPFISCEIFTCEIEIIIKTLVEDEELMGLLFSFVKPDRPHGTLLAGYFSKVVICLLMRKPAAVMHYLQAHQEILKQLVDLISITSIMEVLIRLMGADDTSYAFHEDSYRWLADTDLLEMLLDKLGPLNSSEAHVNTADALSAVSRLSQSELATKLSSPSFIQRLFNQALEAKDSRSTLVHSLTVCISLLDPKKYVVAGIGRGQQIPDSLVTTNPEVIDGMLQRLGDLLKLLDVSDDETVLPTTYGELRPPLGIHRLKIVEFLAVLVRTNNEAARQELVRLGAITLVLELFFDYPFNNLLHHQVENIAISCFESNSKLLINHLLLDCDLIARLLKTDENPYVLSTDGKPTVPSSSKAPPKVGNLGHLTRLANRLIQIGNRNADIKEHLQGNPKWVEWQTRSLYSRNMIENVSQWTCGRPSTVRDQPIDSDDDVFKRDYDIPTMASNINHEVFRYDIFDHEDGDEGVEIAERDVHDVFFYDESAEVVMSSLRLGEEHDRGRSKDSFLSGSNWFAQSCLAHRFEENHAANGSSSGDDDVVLGEEDDLADTATSSANAYFPVVLGNGPNMARSEAVSGLLLDLSSGIGKLSISDDSSSLNNGNMNTDEVSLRSVDWANWKEPSMVAGTSGRMIFSDNNPFNNAGAFVPLWEEGQQQEEIRHGDFDVTGVVEHNADKVPNDECNISEDHQTSMPMIHNSEKELEAKIKNTEGTPAEDVREPTKIKSMEKILVEGIKEAAETANIDKIEIEEAVEIKSTENICTRQVAEVNITETSGIREVVEFESTEETSLKDIREAVRITSKEKTPRESTRNVAETATIENRPSEGIKEAEPIHPLENPSKNEVDSQEQAGGLDFNDSNYWRSDYNSSVAEVKSS